MLSCPWPQHQWVKETNLHKQEQLNTAKSDTIKSVQARILPQGCHVDIEEYVYMNVEMLPTLTLQTYKNQFT